MEYLFIVIYLLFLVLVYIFIMRRMKSISYRHMTNTGIKSLGRGYEIIRRRLIVILIVLFCVSTFLILTYSNNDLFFKIGLHDNKETLDNAFF